MGHFFKSRAGSDTTYGGPAQLPPNARTLRQPDTAVNVRNVLSPESLQAIGLASATEWFIGCCVDSDQGEGVINAVRHVPRSPPPPTVSERMSAIAARAALLKMRGSDE